MYQRIVWLEGMERMNDTKAVENRTEKILRLKEFEKNNKVHMNALSDIMGYGKYSEHDIFEHHKNNMFSEENMYSEDADYMKRSNQTRDEKYGLKARLIFCVFLFAAVLLDRYVFFQLPQSFYQKFDKEIQIDYSVSVIDFIKDIPYTLDYEKTGIK